MLTREQILAPRSNELARETVSVPEWDGDVLVSVMNGADRDAWEREISESGRDGFFQNARARLVAYSVVDEQGNRLFSTADVDALGKLSWIALHRVADVAQRLNKLTKADIEEMKGN